MTRTTCIAIDSPDYYDVQATQPEHIHDLHIHYDHLIQSDDDEIGDATFSYVSYNLLLDEVSVSPNLLDILY